MDNLKKKGCLIINHCPFCLSNNKSLNLFHGAPVRIRLRDLAFGLLHIKWVRSSLIQKELLAWDGKCCHRNKKPVVAHISHDVIFWMMWKERNR